MPEFPPNYVTLSYDGPHGDREFVVACKGRPFSILTVPNFPIPASTLIDFNLVRDLKIRMSELQCAKFHYGGHKLRILGKISTSVQCIKDGNQAGTLHLKATVVQDLYQTFETHSIAGTKLSEKFVGPPYHLSPKTEPSKDAPASPKRKKKKKSKNSPGSDSSPTTTHSPSGWTPPSSSHSTPTRSRSPPGFPTSPMYSPTGKGFPSSTFSPRVATCLPPPPEPPHNMHTRSPLSVNIARLTAAFGSADLAEEFHDEQAHLADNNPGGTFEMGNSGRGFWFYKSRDQASDPSVTYGPIYQSGHGRNSCRLNLLLYLWVEKYSPGFYLLKY